METDLESLVRGRFELLSPTMTEATTRLWAAAEARALGRGGVAMVTRAAGVSRNRILAGLRELEDPDLRAHLGAGRVRRPGGGRKPLTETQPALPEALDRLVSPATRGDPMSPLRWSSKSTEKLAAALRAEGFRVPEHPFPTDAVRPIASGKTPYLRFDRNDYSIPHTLVGRSLTLVASTTSVRVLDGPTEVDRRRDLRPGARSGGRAGPLREDRALPAGADRRDARYGLRRDPSNS